MECRRRLRTSAGARRRDPRRVRRRERLAARGRGRGHQAWRNDPSHLKVLRGTTLRIANKGGRPHAFTKVAAFGGGTAPNPALNEGLITSPECLASVIIPPGSSSELSGLALGNHRFICCLHPWMRALIKVQAQ